MNFIGYDLLKDSNAVNPNYNPSVIYSISLYNGKFSEMYLSKDTSLYKSDIKDWNDNTVIYVDFSGQTSSGGNLPYVLENIAYFRLKRREVGKFEWTGLYEHYFDDINDINFTYIDNYAKGNNTEYEYCITPVSYDGIEQTYNTVKVVSDFDGAVISDKNNSYHILLEPSVTSTTKNKQGTVIVTMNNKYPYVFYGSNSDYYSGEFSGVAIKYNENDVFDIENSVEYRNNLLNWLTDGNPKILKMYDGRIWMINISGNITSDCSEHYNKVKISFEFVEIGDSSSTEDLYNNGFVDYSTTELGVLK